MEELTHPWVRGTHFLFTVPTCSFPSNVPESIFIFFRLKYPSYVCLSSEHSQHPQSPVRFLTTLPSTRPNYLTPPFPPPTQDDPRPKPLPALTTISTTTFSAPFTRPHKKKGYFPSYHTSSCITSQIFATAIILGNKLYVLLVQAELSSSLGESVPENRATSGEVKRKASTFRDLLAPNTWPRVFLFPGPQTPVVVASILITTVAPTSESSPSPSSSQHF